MIDAKAQENSTFIETMRAVQSLKIFNRESDRESQWLNRYADIVNANVRLGRTKIAFTSINDALFGLENIITIYLAARLALSNSLTIGMVFAFISYKQDNICFFDSSFDQERMIHCARLGRRRWRRSISKNSFTMADKAFYGFKSWNDFFIRQFKPGMRPIAEPANRKAIVNACEFAPFAISTNVKEYDTFWIKSQPYSLRQMLNGKHVQEFIGGTIYQAFLSAESYHRWHSPVAGTILSIHQVEGTYYAEAASEAFDESGPNNSKEFVFRIHPWLRSSAERDHFPAASAVFVISIPFD